MRCLSPSLQTGNSVLGYKHLYKHRVRIAYSVIGTCEYFLCCDVFTIVSGFFPPLLHLPLTSTFAFNMTRLFVPGYMNC